VHDLRQVDTRLLITWSGAMSETALRSAIVVALNASGLVRAWSVHAGRVKVRGGWMYLCPPGTPDVLGYTLRSGRFLGLEIKVPGNKTEKARAEKQAAFQTAIRASGGIAGQVENADEAVALVREAIGAGP
jgi:hypothetical protein